LKVGLAQQNLSCNSRGGEEEEEGERRGESAMDIITQLQEQLSEMAMVAVNTFGTLQRDAPPDRLSSSYPDPLNPNPKPEEDAKSQAPAQPGAAPAPPPPPAPPPQPPALDLAEHPKAMSHALVLAAKRVRYSLRPSPLGLATWSTKCPPGIATIVLCCCCENARAEGRDLTVGCSYSLPSLSCL